MKQDCPSPGPPDAAFSPGNGAANVFLKKLFGVSQAPLSPYSIWALIAISGLSLVPTATIMLAALPQLLLAADGLPFLFRILLVVLAIAPVSLAMGMPFPLGLAALGDSAFLPWAWGLNGAFSVVATPLANLLLRNIGLTAVLGGAVLLYVIAATSFPAVSSALARLAT